MNFKMPKKAAFIGILTAVCLAFSGCQLRQESNVTTLSLDDTGEITHTITEPKEGDFTEDELKDFVQKEIDGFKDSSNTSGKITLSSVSVKNGTVEIEMHYPSAESYAAFNGVLCFNGTVKEAMNAGYGFDSTFLDEDGKEQDSSAILERSDDWKVLIVEEPMNLRLPDKILYTSTNLKITGRYQAEADTDAWDTDGTSSAGTAGAESVSASSSGEAVRSGSAESASSGKSGQIRLEDLTGDEYETAFVIYK